MPRRSLLRVLITSVIFFVLLLALGAQGFKKLAGMRAEPERVERETPGVAVQTLTLERGAHREMLVGYGRARALRNGEVGAEVAGVVTWIAPELEAGTAVTTSTDLVRLESRDYVKDRAMKAAALARAESVRDSAVGSIANLDRRLGVVRDERDAAKREVQRIEGLVQAGADTVSTLDRQKQIALGLERQVVELEWRREDAERTKKQSGEDVKSARAALDLAELQVERCTIRARFPGVVAQRTVQLGARVAPGTSLFRIIDPSRVEIPVSIPASRYGEVDAGTAVTAASVRGEDVEWSAKISRIAAEVTEERTFLVYVEVDNRDTDRPPLPAGAFVRVTIPGKRHADVIAVPRTAFVGDLVFVVEGGETPVARARRPVVSRLLAGVALVTSGLDPGETIVASNLEEVHDGRRLRLAGAAANGAGR